MGKRAERRTKSKGQRGRGEGIIKRGGGRQREEEAINLKVDKGREGGNKILEGWVDGMGEKS